MLFEKVVKAEPNPCRIKAHFVVVPLALFETVSTRALVLYLRATCLGGLDGCGYFESRATIAAYLNVCEKTVDNLIKELERAGAIIKDDYSGQGAFQGTRILRCRKINGAFQTIPSSFLELVRIGIDPRRLRLGIYLAKRVRGGQAILTRAKIAKKIKISKNVITRLLIELVESNWVLVNEVNSCLLIRPGSLMSSMHSKPEAPNESDSALESLQEPQPPSSFRQSPSDCQSISLDFPGYLPEVSHNSKPHDLKPQDLKPPHPLSEGSGGSQVLHRMKEEQRKAVQFLADLCHRSIPCQWWSDGVGLKWRSTGHPKTTAAIADVLRSSQITAEAVNDKVFLPLSTWIRLNGCAKDMQILKTPGLIANIIRRFDEHGEVVSAHHLQCPVYWHHDMSHEKEYTTIGDCLEDFLDEAVLFCDATKFPNEVEPEWLANAVLETRTAYEDGLVSPCDADWHDLMGNPLDEEDECA